MEKIKKISIIIILFFCANILYPNILYKQNKFQSKQIILVLTKNWNTTEGELYFWEVSKNKWNKVIENVPVVLASKGLAWGRGLLDINYLKGRLKQEGDSCSPAGIFKIKRAFGYIKKDSLNINLDYFQADSTTFCVDDVNSKYYNQLVNIDTIKQIDWKSRERLRFYNSDLYKFCIVIEHNTENIKPSLGSCIFIHLWLKDRKNSEKYIPTSGCTSLSEENIIKLINLLDKNKNPIIIQLPINEYKKISKIFNLPFDHNME
jgi:D-alanyl-D-alanine dipeptidase